MSDIFTKEQIQYLKEHLDIRVNISDVGYDSSRVRVLVQLKLNNEVIAEDSDTFDKD